MRRTASAAATSAPQSSPSALPSPPADSTARDEGDFSSHISPHIIPQIISSEFSSYYFLILLPHTISSQFFLIVFPHNDILWSIETVSSSIIMFSGLEAGSALDGRASASPTRTQPSHQSLRTLLPMRSS